MFTFTVLHVTLSVVVHVNESIHSRSLLLVLSQNINVMVSRTAHDPSYMTETLNEHQSFLKNKSSVITSPTKIVDRSFNQKQFMADVPKKSYVKGGTI